MRFTVHISGSSSDRFLCDVDVCRRRVRPGSDPEKAQHPGSPEVAGARRSPRWLSGVPLLGPWVEGGGQGHGRDRRLWRVHLPSWPQDGREDRRRRDKLDHRQASASGRPAPGRFWFLLQWDRAGSAFPLQDGPVGSAPRKRKHDSYPYLRSNWPVFITSVSRDGNYRWEDQRRPSAAYKGTSGGVAVCISACDDHQTSSDTTVSRRQQQFHILRPAKYLP